MACRNRLALRALAPPASANAVAARLRVIARNVRRLARNACRLAVDTLLLPFLNGHSHQVARVAQRTLGVDKTANVGRGPAVVFRRWAVGRACVGLKGSGLQAVACHDIGGHGARLGQSTNRAECYWKGHWAHEIRQASPEGRQCVASRLWQTEQQRDGGQHWWSRWQAW